MSFRALADARSAERAPRNLLSFFPLEFFEEQRQGIQRIRVAAIPQQPCAQVEIEGAPFKPGVGLSGEVTLADAIKSLKQGVSRRLIGEATHFWQKRYYDFNIRNHDQFVEKLHYIHQNPVTRGLCACAEDWPWSSFRHHAAGCEGHRA